MALTKYVVDSNVPSYARAWGLDLGNKFVEANSESEAKRIAVAMSGIPGAAISVTPIYIDRGSVAGGLQQLGSTENLPPQMTPEQENRFATREAGDWSTTGGSDAAFSSDPSNIEGFYRSAPRDDSFTSFVTNHEVPQGGLGTTYDPLGMSRGADPTDTQYNPRVRFDTTMYDPLGGGVFNPELPHYAPPGTVGPGGRTYAQPAPQYNPLGEYSADQIDAAEAASFAAQERIRQAAIREQAAQYNPLGDYSATQAAAAKAAEMDALESVRFANRAAEERKREAEEREGQKQASLLTGPVRSWDSKLGDISINPDGTVTLPADMWRNATADRTGRGDVSTDQPIGREQIEDAIRRIAELGGRDNLDRSVSNMLQQARNYYSTTSRGDNTWDKNIDSGLIDGKLLADAGFKATWGSFADEVLGDREAAVESQIPDGWRDTQEEFDTLSDTQQRDAIDRNLKNVEEVESWTSSQAKQIESGIDAEALYDVGKGVGIGDELPEFTTKGFYPPDEDFDSAEADRFAREERLRQAEKKAAEAASQSAIFDPEGGLPPAGAAGAFPVYSSQELINDPQGYLTAAGQRLALRNVFGEPATGVGPLASYLQRQTFPLTNAYRGASWANMAREQAGGVAPQVSFEDFLRTTRNQPSGLSGTYGQALQDVDYLRGLGGSQVPVGLEGVFNPEQAAGTRDARNLLQAAQRGKYSGLVSSAFRRPTEDDLFSDYVLARQDASTAGTAPQNFLNFAASRYGL